MADPDAPASKRPRLDSGNPVLNGHGFPPPPPPPPHTIPTRPPSHPPLVQASSPPPSRHYPPNTLPPPPPPQPQPPLPPLPYRSPVQGSYPRSLPSPSLPPSDIRALADPRNILSPGQRPHGVVGPAPVIVSQDRIPSYRAPPTPQPDHHSSRSTTLSVDVKAPPPPQGMEHGGHQSPWSMNPDHRPNGNGANGYGHTISPPHPNGPPYHPPPPPPPPQQPNQQYGQPDAYAQSPYMGGYGGVSAHVRRKQVRATQACNHCRSRKQKCDEARPCQFCRENNFDCQYKDVPPPKQDRSMMQLQDTVNHISDALKDFVGDFQSWRQSVESRLAPGRGLDAISSHASPEATFAVPLRDQSTPMYTPTLSRGHPSRVNSMKMESPGALYSHVSPIATQASTPIKQETTMVPPQQPATPADSVRTDHSRATDNLPREKNGLQSDHSTPAHKLLEEWVSMHVFYKDVEYLQRLIENNHDVSDYPMQLEQDRGLIRVWGIGEGQDLNDGAQGPGSPESSNESEATSPAPGKDGVWGHPPLDHSTPGTHSSSPGIFHGDMPRESQGTAGGLGPDGRPDFNSQLLNDLTKSYTDNIHVLHPFLNLSKLQRMVREFSEQYSPDIKPTNARSPAASSLPHQLSQGVKRKRSTTTTYGEPYSPRGAIERSMRNAIVLLVLALGKVCAYTGELPAPQRDKNAPYSGNRSNSRDSPRLNGSFNSDVSEDPRPRNIDTLPGMAYFAYATDILGNQQGGNTVAHAQAMILAALYLSQFARVLESWSWIHNACRVTMVLIKKDYPKLLRSFYVEKKGQVTPKERYKLNLVMCAYWTCLQLESDILAEMSTLPPSSISAHQSNIMYPAGVSENFPSDNSASIVSQPKGDTSMMIYSSQIWLRVILNEAHNALYGANGRSSFDTSNVKEVADHAKIHIDILESWRQVLPPVLEWKDEDHPSTDLNIARLRAKYYGGLYMMLRPYLRIASQTVDYGPYVESGSGSGSTTTRGYFPMSDLTEDHQNIIKVACRCIESAIQSTIAFDRVGAEPNSPYIGYKCTRTKRLVLTNIFGTLHAQFGNMLVLTAVFQSKLFPLLPKSTPLNKNNLIALLARTINVLEEVSQNSPILQMDLQILYNVRKQADLEPR